jgi:8-oxo-dGTP pyrophosphatase MutT (NUDIX family)
MILGHSARSYFAEKIKQLLGTEPCRIQVAALPWRRGPDGVEVMLITSRDTGRWVLPKGWPEKDERLCEAALREADEEAGLSGAVCKREAGRYHYAKLSRSGEEYPCEVIVFPLEVDKVADKWKERRQRERKWMSAAEASQTVRESGLAELIAAFCADPRRYAA